MPKDPSQVRTVSRRNQAICLAAALATGISAYGTALAADRNETAPPSLEKFQQDVLTKKVLNLDVTFHWIGDSDRVWFERQTPSGDDVVVVDAGTGVQSPAFSPDTLRAALNTARPGALDSRPSQMSGLSFEGDGSNLIVKTPDGAYTCDVPVTACSVRIPQGADQVVSPDGREEVFRQQNDLWLREVATGRVRRLTFDGIANFGYGDVNPGFDSNQVARRRAGTPEPLAGVLWSPDGRFIIALRQDLRPYPERLYVTEYAPPDGAYDYAHLRKIPLARDATAPDSRLVVIDAGTGAIRRVDLDPQSLNDYAVLHFLGDVVWWNTHDQKVYLITANRGGTRYALDAVDLTTGRSTEILQETSRFNVRLNPFDYARPDVYVLANGKEIIWYSEQSGNGHLYLHDAVTGKLIRELTHGDWVAFDLLRVDEKKRLAYFTAATRVKGANPYYRYLYRVSLDGGEPQLLTPEIADHDFNDGAWLNRVLSGRTAAPTGSSMSPSGRYFVDRHSTTDQPPEYVLRRASGKLVTKVLASDVSALVASGWRAPERVMVKAADGITDLYGVIVRPSHFDPTRKYPVIDMTYPGPQGSFAPRAFLAGYGPGAICCLQTFADAGFIVVAIDGRGTAYRSRAFRDAFLGTEDVFGAADHVAAIKNLAAQRSYMDVDRVGIWGQSFGGYGSMRAMLLYPDFFKVGVSGTGPAEWFDMQAQISVERFFGVPSDSDRARAYYELSSNTRLASRLKGRVLLIYGGIDENVSLKNAFETINAFIKADRDIDLLIMPDSPHRAPDEPYAVRRSVEYFVEHLAERSE